MPWRVPPTAGWLAVWVLCAILYWLRSLGSSFFTGLGMSPSRDALNLQADLPDPTPRPSMCCSSHSPVKPRYTEFRSLRDARLVLQQEYEAGLVG